MLYYKNLYFAIQQKTNIKLLEHNISIQQYDIHLTKNNFKATLGLKEICDIFHHKHPK